MAYTRPLNQPLQGITYNSSNNQLDDKPTACGFVGFDTISQGHSRRRSCMGESVNSWSEVVVLTIPPSVRPCTELGLLGISWPGMFRERDALLSCSLASLHDAACCYPRGCGRSPASPVGVSTFSSYLESSPYPDLHRYISFLSRTAHPAILCGGDM